MKTEYQYELLSKSQKVICQVCGKEFMNLALHVKSHNITIKEYKIKFPDAPIVSPLTKIIKKNIKYDILVNDEKIPVNEITDDERDLNIPTTDVNPIIDKEIIFNNKIYTSDNLKNIDICTFNKDKMLNFLKLYFKNIEKDYMIREYSIDNKLLYEVISDFADPILKINIEFPNAFWHNSMTYNNPLRKSILESYGWKVLELKNTNISSKDFNNILIENNISN
jgi:hypothetical protein